jgi:hypothetical protein
MYRVQIGWDKGSYRDKCGFSSKFQAYKWYNGVVVHSGGKKRLLDPKGKVIEREIT